MDTFVIIATAVSKTKIRRIRGRSMVMQIKPGGARSPKLNRILISGGGVPVKQL